MNFTHKQMKKKSFLVTHDISNWSWGVRQVLAVRPAAHENQYVFLQI